MLVKPVSNGDWPGWRGKNRDGRVDWLPDVLPDSFKPDWTARLTGDGVGGVCVANGHVIVGSRDLLDQNDVFQCFSVEDGSLLWQHFYPASGELDYGNSPRATPLIHEDVVFTYGAFGDVYCIELESGLPFWHLNVATEFDSPEMTWGHSGSPLIVSGNLIVQPGGKSGSLVALDPDTGDVVWKSAGISAGYSSFIAGIFGGRHQIIGYDAVSLGGWDAKDGSRIWSLIPPEKGDFNVPTVVPYEGDIFVSTENNGTRRYTFGEQGKIYPQPIAINHDLQPDSHTPVISGKRIHGIWNEFYSVNLKTLKTEFTSADDAFGVYASVVASESRLLCLTEDGELILMSTDGKQPRILSRKSLTGTGVDVLAHPAVAGTSLYVRIGRELRKLPLN